MQFSYTYIEGCIPEEYCLRRLRELSVRILQPRNLSAIIKALCTTVSSNKIRMHWQIWNGNYNCRQPAGIKHQGDLLEKMLDQMDKRFMQVDKRLEELRGDMNKRFSQLQWSMGIGFTILAALMGVFKFLLV